MFIEFNEEYLINKNDVRNISKAYNGNYHIRLTHISGNVTFEYWLTEEDMNDRFFARRKIEMFIELGDLVIKKSCVVSFFKYEMEGIEKPYQLRINVGDNTHAIHYLTKEIRDSEYDRLRDIFCKKED